MATRATTIGTPRKDIMAALVTGMMGFAPIGTELLTPASTPHKRGAFGQIPVAALFEKPNVLRTKKSGANRSTWDYGEITYSNQTYAHEELDNDEESAEYEDYFDYEKIAAQRGVDIINRNMEYDIMSALHNTTTFTGATNTGAAAVEWNTAATATPISDVTTGIMAIRNKCGMVADTLQVSFEGWRDLSLCTQIRGAISYTEQPGGFIPLDQLAGALGVKRIVVPGDGNMYNSGVENSAGTVTLGELWNKEYAFLCVTNKSPDVAAPCIGRTFNWAKGGGMMTVDDYEEPQTESHVIRAKQSRHAKVSSAAFGYLISNCHT